MTVLVTVDGTGIVQQIELDALGFGMLNFFLTCRQLVAAAAIGDIDMLGTKTLCHTRRIHRDISGADDGDTVKVLDGCVIIVTVCLHEVCTGQKLVG